jgi:beta-lactamase class A
VTAEAVSVYDFEDESRWSRNGDQWFHAARATVRELLRKMISASSNVATNVLVERLGARPELEGVRLRRGVEDEAAWAAGINNEVTAEGLVGLLRVIAESPAMLAPMFEVADRRELPAGLPVGTRVAHKPGNISTVAHDAGRARWRC